MPARAVIIRPANESPPMHPHMPDENPRRPLIRKIRRRKTRLPLEVGSRNLKLPPLTIGAENKHALDCPDNHDQIAAMWADCFSVFHNCVLSVLTSGPPSHYRKGLAVRFLSDRRQVLRETVEAAAPSGVVRIASCDRFEDRVMQRKL